MIASARWLAAGLGIAVIGWQAGNAWSGRFLHAFLPADLIIAVWLIISACCCRPDRPRTWALVAMLSGFGAMFGVFLAATSGRILLGGFDLGTAAAALGLIPSALGIERLGRALTASDSGSASASASATLPPTHRPSASTQGPEGGKT